MIFWSRIPFIKNINQSLVNQLVNESLEQTRDVYEKKIKMTEEQYKKQIRELEHNHHITFQQYKKEHETLVAQIMNRAEEIKKEAAKEKKKALDVYKEALDIKEKFSKLHFKVKTLYNGIDSIMKSTVIAETEIVNLISDVERDMSFRSVEMEKQKDKLDSKVTPLKQNAFI